MSKKHLIILGLAFAAITVIARLIPHPWNFTPLGSLMIFSGFLLPRRWLLLPLAGLALSDALIGAYHLPVMLAVYGTYGLTVWIAYQLRGHYSFANVIAASLGAGVLFFLTTNAAVWLWSGMYSPGIDGLFAAYTAGIPFFRNSLAGYAAFSLLFFGAYEAGKLSVSKFRAILNL